MSDFNNLPNELTNFLYDPTAMQRKMYEAMDKLDSGEHTIVDPTNPFSLLMEMAAASSHSVAINNLTTLRKLTPTMALTEQDLYRHMADIDYLHRFATPAKTQVVLLIPRSSLLNNAVVFNDNGDKKITLPRYTQITAEGVPFINTYPVNFVIPVNGGIRITYDTDTQSVLETAQTNLVDWRNVKVGDLDLIAVTLDVIQLARKTYNETLTPGGSFTRTYQLPDQYYYCTIEGLGNAGQRVPFKTTHSEEVYDINTPTALLRVIDNKLTVTIPLIYLNQTSIPSNLQIVIYTTRGKVNMNLADYTADAYAYQLGSQNVSERDVYTSAFTNVTDVAISSDRLVDGGSNGLTFDQLRQRVIDNANNINLPITEQQLKAKLNISGYDIIKSVDTLMQRIYLASRRIPNTPTSGFTQAMGCSIDTLQISYSVLASMSTVRDHGDRMTLFPDTLYHYTNGKLKAVLDGQYPSDVAQTNEELASLFNTGNYVYSPFYYVLDASDGTFGARAYSDVNVSVYNREFIGNNDKLDLAISCDAFSIEKTSTGYKLTVSTVSDDNFKAMDTNLLHAQLTFAVQRESGRASIVGELIGLVDEEYVWQFTIPSDMDINRLNELVLNNVNLPAGSGYDVNVTLDQLFDIVFVVSGQSTDASLRSDIDTYVDTNPLPTGCIGVGHERFMIHFVEPLTHLWTNGQTVAGQLQYQYHENDVPYLYESDVLEYDEDGTLKVYVDEDNNVQYNVLHQAGDPVMVDGEPQLKYRKGDVVLGNDGEPIVEATRQTDRRVDLLLLDGIYSVADTVRDKQYRHDVELGIVRQLSNDIDAFIDILHENTRLYYYPKKTIGDVSVVTGDNTMQVIPAAMSFSVTYTVSPIAYQDYRLRDNLTQITSEIINQAITQSTVSVTDILARLREAAGDDVIAVDMDKLGPNNAISVFSVTNSSIGRSVKRNLVVQADERLVVVEDIDIAFIKHTA